MVSKKQRAKQIRADTPTNMLTTPAMSLPARAGKASATSNAQEPAPRCACDACIKPAPTADKSDSPFLRMPREVRDKIYQELLVAKVSPDAQEKIDQIKKAERTPCGEFGRENALEYFDDTGIMPGSDKKYPFIVDALGLLLANKQIHAEANAVLSGQNNFVILVEWERVHSFWRCDNPRCDPPGRPCFIMFHNFTQIKHLEILIQNTRVLDDPMLRVESARLNANLKTVVDSFKYAGNKLKTLKIRYTSCFNGEIQAMLNDIEGPLDPDMPERRIMLRDNVGKYHHMTRAEAQERLFKHCNLLEPLRQLKGVAEDVKMRGDLPQAYMDELIAIMSVDDPSALTKKKHAVENAAKQAGRPEPDMRSFFRGLREKYLKEGNQGSADLCAQMMRVPAKSPSVMAELMRPPTQEELDRIRVQPAPVQPMPFQAAPVITSDSDDEASEDENSGDTTHAGGLGMLNGRPVFGPPRPPHLS